MDGGLPVRGLPSAALPAVVLARLMPMHLLSTPGGRLISAGPTLAKAVPGAVPGARFASLFDVRRPAGAVSPGDLAAAGGARMSLVLRGEGVGLRGLAVPVSRGRAILMNLSFGIGVAAAVRRFGLTQADFAPTDLTVELLYLAEAKEAVSGELRAMANRIEGGRRKAQQQALTDALTGLANRRGLEADLARLQAQGAAYALLQIDLDRFKAVNDSLGHAAGDAVLAAVGRVLGAETRAGDSAARLGGDEFALVLPDMADPTLLGAVSRRIIAGLERPVPFDGVECRISGSIGVALARGGEDPGLVMAAADEALYRSKHAGRGVAHLMTAARGPVPI